MTNKNISSHKVTQTHFSPTLPHILRPKQQPEPPIAMCFSVFFLLHLRHSQSPTCVHSLYVFDTMSHHNTFKSPTYCTIHTCYCAQFIRKDWRCATQFAELWIIPLLAVMLPIFWSYSMCHVFARSVHTHLPNIIANMYPFGQSHVSNCQLSSPFGHANLHLRSPRWQSRLGWVKPPRMPRCTFKKYNDRPHCSSEQNCPTPPSFVLNQKHDAINQHRTMLIIYNITWASLC